MQKLNSSDASKHRPRTNLALKASGALSSVQCFFGVTLVLATPCSKAVVAVIGERLKFEIYLQNEF